MTTILGIETTCDETAAAVVIDGRQILSNVIASQIPVHRPYGGVVPEIASRHHIHQIEPVIQQAVKISQCTIDQLDAIAVAKGPGLMGSLLVGVQAAKGLAMGLGLPLIGVNHVEAHLYAAILGKENVSYPALGLVISGGHTALFRINQMSRYALIGSTVDDAIGEAFDKVAALLGFPYPGGPEVERLAHQGDPNRYPFRGGRVKSDRFAFSFSGLKTAVLYGVKEAIKQGELNPSTEPDSADFQVRCDLAASFQRAAFEDLAEKIKGALSLYPCTTILYGGGVTNNQTLRAKLLQAFPAIDHYWPSFDLTSDNGAMIGGLAYEYLKQAKPREFGLNFSVEPQLRPFWITDESCATPLSQRSPA